CLCGTGVSPVGLSSCHPERAAQRRRGSPFESRDLGFGVVSVLSPVSVSTSSHSFLQKSLSFRVSRAAVTREPSGSRGNAFVLVIPSEPRSSESRDLGLGSVQGARPCVLLVVIPSEHLLCVQGVSPVCFSSCHPERAAQQRLEGPWFG